MIIKKVCSVCENEFWARGNRAKYCSPKCKNLTKKEITKASMLSPLFNEFNPQDKKTIIAKLRERIEESEDEVKKLGTLKTGDRRAHHRKKVLALVDYVTLDKFSSDYVHNISEGGMFIQTRRPLAVGTEITVTFIIHESGLPIKIKGEVMWTGENGMGIKITEVGDLTKGKLNFALSGM